MQNAARALRAAILNGEPEDMARLHKILTILWALSVIPVFAFGWHESVPVVVVISIYANVVGHWSSFQAAKAEVRIQDQQDT